MDNFENLSNQDIFSSGQQVEDLLKAMSAGSQTGRELNGLETGGSALKTESLEPTVKILTNKDTHIKFWKQIPKQTAYNTVEEFNQLVEYGGNVGIFNSEGETPQFTDSIYRRESVAVKFMGVSGEVTHPFQLVRTAGIGDALANEVMNKTSFLLREINKNLVTADSSKIGIQFDGIFRQHHLAVTGGSSLAGTPALDSYFNDSVVIDARGNILSDAYVEEAVNGVTQDNFGFVSQIIARPKVFSDYVKQFHESKRVMVNNPMAATTGATMGQAVNTIMTQAGAINVQDDIFFDYKVTRVFNAAATNPKAPAVPTAGVAPVAAVADTSNKFGAAYAGDYYYAVAAKNRYGESAMLLLNAPATPVAVAATESVDLQFVAGVGAYAAESYVIYRTEAVTVGDQTNNKFYPIFTVSLAELANGFDGAAATKVRDRNRWIANTTSALVYDVDPDIFAYKQLFPISRMDLAITAPARRFMVLSYGTPVLYAGKKIARIVNIGAKMPS